MCAMSGTHEELMKIRFSWDTASRAVSVFRAMPISTADAVHTSVHRSIPGEFHKIST